MALMTAPRACSGYFDWSEPDMRAYLLTTLCPALVLLAAACGPSDTTDTASTAEAPAAAPETPAPETPAAAPAAAPTTTAAATTPAAAAPSDQPDPVLAAVALRKSPMKLISWNMGPIRPMLQPNGTFDAAVVQERMTNIALLAGMIPGVFTTDTSASDVETQALPSIWTSKADFDMKAQALMDAATTAATTAAGGDQTATLDAVRALTQTCSGCHDDYRTQ